VQFNAEGDFFIVMDSKAYSDLEKEQGGNGCM
jgi:hypothetical protein